MKKYLMIFIFCFISVFILAKHNLYSQDISIAEEKNLKVNETNADELLKIRIPNLMKKDNYDASFIGEIAIVKIKDDLNDFGSLCLVDMDGKKLLNAFNYVYQYQELNNPRYILASVMMNQYDDKPGTNGKANITLSQPTFDSGSYRVSIIRIDIYTGKGEILVNNAVKLHSNDSSTEKNIKWKTQYFDYIPEVNMFAYIEYEELKLYNFNSNKIKSIDISKISPVKYLGHMYNLGNIVLLRDVPNVKKIYIYDILYGKLYNAGNNVVPFDLIDEYNPVYYYPLIGSKAFLSIQRDKDTNGDGSIDKLDNTKLYISYVNTKKRHMVYEGSINSLTYHEGSQHISFDVRTDFNRDGTIDYNDDTFKLYLYDTIDKQRIFISRRGDMIGYIDHLGLFVYYSHDKDSNEDGILDTSDEPETLLYSTITKKIKKLSNGAIIAYERFKHDSFVYYVQKDGETFVYIYNSTKGKSSLMAKNAFLEQVIGDTGKILFRRSDTYGGSANSELIIYDDKTETLDSLGKDYISLNKLPGNTISSDDNNMPFSNYIESNNVLIMVQQTRRIDSEGKETLSGVHNLVIYDLNKNLKNVIFQGEIYDYSFIPGRDNKMIVTIRPEGKVNFSTYIININNLNTIQLKEVVKYAGSIDNNRFFVLISADEDKNSLFLYDNKENYLNNIYDRDIVPLYNFITSEKSAYTSDDYAVFLKTDNEGTASLCRLKALNDVIILGDVNGNFFCDEYLSYFVLINYKSDKQIIEISFYSL